MLMRKILTAIICSLLLPAGVAMAMTAGDKKDDKKGDKGTTTDRPVVIIIWEEAWPPIHRLSPDTDPVSPLFVLPGAEPIK